MWFTGKLRFDQRGAGSIIGAVFIFLILFSGYMFYALQVNVENEYNETLQDMQQLDLKRNRENIEFITVRFDDGKLNITVRNIGSYQAHLIWLGIFDGTVTPSAQEYYEIDFYVNPAETVTNVGNDAIPSFEGQERTIQLVTGLGNTFSCSYPLRKEEAEYDFVDSEGGPPAIGSHSFFEAMQSGPDGVSDTLSESSSIQWISPTGYEDPGNQWSSETNAYDDDTSTRAASNVPGGNTWSSYLVLTHSGITSNMIRYYIGRQDTSISRVEIDIYDSTWTNVYSGPGTWDAWANVSFAETSVTSMRFRFLNTRPAAPQRRMAYVYEADFLPSIPNYALDLEVQWTGVDYDETYEWLSIYCGTMGSEDIYVDVWNGTDWVTVLTDLESGWNSVDVSPYLVSSTFKIRFRDTIRAGDAVQDSWEIDATFLHVWS